MIDNKLRALLPALMVDTMDALGVLTNAPYELTFPVVMSIMNFPAQARYNVNPIVWKKCPVTLYFMSLVPSGGMKTGVTSYVTVGIDEFQKQQKIATKDAYTDYLIAEKVYRKEIDLAAKDPTNSPTPEEPVKPRGHQYKIEKGTTNGIMMTLETVPFSGLFNTDAAEFFNSHSFQDSSKAMEMISMLSKLWSGENIERLTGVRENNVSLYNRRFNMLALIQQQLATFLTDSQYKDQGFTNRFLISQCVLFKKPFVDITKLADVRRNQDLLDPFNDRILAMCQDVIKTQIKQHATALQIGKEYEPNELVLECIEFSTKDKAQEIMIAYYNKLRDDMFLDENKEVQNFVSRMYEHAVRVAATLAIFAGDKVINERFAEAGCLVAEMYLEQRKNLEIDGNVKEDLVTKCVEQMTILVEKNIAKGRKITKTWATNFGTALYRKGLSEEQRAKVWEQIAKREEERLSEGGENK